MNITADYKPTLIELQLALNWAIQRYGENDVVTWEIRRQIAEKKRLENAEPMLPGTEDK